MSTITSASAVFCWEEALAADGDRAQHPPVRARVVSALDPGSLMRDRPATAGLTGVLGAQSLAGFRKDSP
jgi:hypothetical protein